jgi:hypothetical protein
MQNKKGEKMVSPPLSQKEALGRSANAKVPQLSDERRKTRESFGLSGSMKRVASDPELHEGPFRGVVLHSEAAGPAANLHAGAGEREKVCFFLFSVGLFVLTSPLEKELLEEIVLWKKKYYEACQERDNWMRQAEEWKDRFLEAQDGAGAGGQAGENRVWWL